MVRYRCPRFVCRYYKTKTTWPSTLFVRPLRRAWEARLRGTEEVGELEAICMAVDTTVVDRARLELKEEEDGVGRGRRVPPTKMLAAYPAYQSLLQATSFSNTGCVWSASTRLDRG